MRRNFVRTKAPPLPGLTCWNSTIFQILPSISMWLPLRNWLVETVIGSDSSDRAGTRSVVAGGGLRDQRRGGAAAEDAAGEARGEDAEVGGDGVLAGDVALGAAAGADLVDRLGDLLGGAEDQAAGGFGAQLGLREAFGRDEAGQDHADVDAVRRLLEREGVGPADQRELARRVGARAGAADAARGAGVVDEEVEAVVVLFDVGADLGRRVVLGEVCG